MVRCPNCDTENPDDTTYCIACKADLSGLKLLSIEPSEERLPGAGRRGTPRGKIVTVIILALVVIAGTIVFVFGGRMQGEGTYSNAEVGFEVQTPSGWDLREIKMPNGVVYAINFSQTGDDSYIRVGRYTSSHSSLQDWVEDVKFGITAQVGGSGTLVSDHSRTVNGVQGWEIIAISNSGEKYKEILLLVDGSAYIIHCEANPSEMYDQLDPTFEQVINSFKLI